MPAINPVKFRDLLLQTFSAGDLVDLAWVLRIDYDDLPGDTRNAKARELIVYCSHRGQVEALLAEAQKLRPHLDWTAETRDETAVPPPVASPAPPAPPVSAPDDEAMRELRVFRGLLDDAWGLFVSQNDQRGRLYRSVRVNHAAQIAGLRGYDEIFYAAYDHMTPRERELFALVRGMTRHAVHQTNSRIRQWIEEHPVAELLPTRTPAVDELERQIRLLELHLAQWFSKYEAVFLPDEKRALVYLGDEKSHGQAWPRGLEPAVDVVLAELGKGDMRVFYDRTTDTLSVVFSENPVAESGEGKPGIILDYDATGNLVSVEILDASRRVVVPQRVEYRVSPGKSG